MQRGIASWFAIGFGLGLSPVMPGTIGTLWAFPIACILKAPYAYFAYPILCLLAYISADIEGKRVGDHDHPSIVCDEIIGILPVLLWFDYAYWPMAFVLFRLFDIVKPWPISWFDENIQGAAGCLLDDMIAGYLAGIVLLFLQYRFSL